MKRAAVSDGPQLVIDNEFKKLIPPISEQELELLEASVLRFGCLDPLIVWDQGNKLILLDGHNRFSICEKHGKPHRLSKLTFEDRLAARIWMRRHQLGRRNLTDEMRRYTIGELYNDEKLVQGRPAKENTVNSGAKKGSPDEPLISGDTATRIADEQNVSRHSVINAGKFASNVDTIGEKSPELKAAILSGEVTASAADLEALSEAPKRKVESVAKKVAAGDKKAIKEAVEKEEVDDKPAVDPNGLPITKKLAHAFEAQPQFRSIVQQLGKLQSEIDELRKSPAGVFLAEAFERIKAEIGNAQREVKFAMPYQVCPYCKGAGCKRSGAEKTACRQTGWTVKGVKGPGE